MKTYTHIFGIDPDINKSGVAYLNMIRRNLELISFGNVVRCVPERYFLTSKLQFSE